MLGLQDLVVQEKKGRAVVAFVGEGKPARRVVRGYRLGLVGRGRFEVQTWGSCGVDLAEKASKERLKVKIQKPVGQLGNVGTS